MEMLTNKGAGLGAEKGGPAQGLEVKKQNRPVLFHLTVSHPLPAYRQNCQKTGDGHLMTTQLLVQTRPSVSHTHTHRHKMHKQIFF